jgi:phosphotransferase system enzyme I (PtsI)
MTETFLAIGVDELSVTPRAVLPLRNKIRSLDMTEATARILAEIDGDSSPKF